MVTVTGYLEASVFCLESYLWAQSSGLYPDLSEIAEEWRSFLDILDPHNQDLSAIRGVITELSDFSSVPRARDNLSALKDRIEDLKRRNIRIYINLPRDADRCHLMDLDKSSS